MDGEDQMALKRAFCEFFMKLLPGIIDPKQIIRQRWHKFRDILLNENKSAQDILAYVKGLKFHIQQEDDTVDEVQSKNDVSQLQSSRTSSIQASEQSQYWNQYTESPTIIIGTSPYQKEKVFTYPKSPIQQARSPAQYQVQISSQYSGQSPASLLQAQGNMLIIQSPQPSGKSPLNSGQDFIQTQGQSIKDNLYLDVKTNKDQNEIRKNQSPHIKQKQMNDEVEHNYSKTNDFRQNNSFSLKMKESILSNISAATTRFRYDSKTLKCVYERSFEIITAGLDMDEIDKDPNEEQPNNESYIAFQQDMQQIRSNQRRNSFKERSIYSRKKPTGLEFLNQKDKVFEKNKL